MMSLRPPPPMQTVTMESLREDVWSYIPSFSVKSSFRLDMTPTWHDSSVEGHFFSRPCGFGWRYSITVEPPPPHSSTSPQANREELTLRLWFDSHRVSGVKCGRLTLGIRQSGTGGSSLKNVIVDPAFPKWILVDCGYLSELETDNAIEITAAFPTTPRAPPSPYKVQRITNLLASTVTTGKDTMDTKFYLFTRRSGQAASHPRALFANSALLEGYSDYLDTLLYGEGFKNSDDVDIDLVGPEFASTQEYDYDSDSDLDSDSEDDLAEVDAPNRVSKGRMGRVVHLQHTAFKTWNALIVYLYTEKITFARLLSEQPTTPEEEGQDVDSTACSPKSMYRLADEAHLNELKDLAFLAIIERISVSNIAKEVFSKFTSLYPEIQKYEVDFLIKNIKQVKDFSATLKSVTMGNLPHSHAVLEMVIDRLSEGR